MALRVISAVSSLISTIQIGWQKVELICINIKNRNLVGVKYPETPYLISAISIKGKQIYMASNSYLYDLVVWGFIDQYNILSPKTI